VLGGKITDLYNDYGLVLAAVDGTVQRLPFSGRKTRPGPAGGMSPAWPFNNESVLTQRYLILIHQAYNQVPED
jgi:hypothetical protein